MDVVIGAAFGDEGKGLITHHLASRYGRDALVVRFNGGAQAGHTVVASDSKRHVFHHIGSGTFAGAATYLSRFFVANPILFLEEIKELQLLKLNPPVYVDPACLITTPYDMLVNQILEDFRGDQRHGSCGFGFGETVERNQHAQFTLTVADLDNTDKIKATLQSIRKEWLPQRLKVLNILSLSEKWQSFIDSDDVLDFYIHNLESFLKLITVTQIDLTKTSYPVIFEGAQGLMLDQDRGWFPHVTRSNTGLKNVLDLVKHGSHTKINVVYVTRSYLTRHGAGPLPHELSLPPYEKVIDKTNITNNYQGPLRFAWFNLSLINKFIQADLALAASCARIKHQLAVTCLDQVDDSMTFVENDKIYKASHESFLQKIAQKIGVSDIFCSYGPTSDTIKNWQSILKFA